MILILRHTPPRKRRPGPPRKGRIYDPEFVAWMHRQPCLIDLRASAIECQPGYECFGRITFHHVRNHGSGRDDRRGLALCLAHHLEGFGKFSIEKLGKTNFQELFGVDLEAEILRYNDDYEATRLPL
jgi:hypothetical protein